MTELIGPYRVEERLGVGGMGEVYKAYDDRLERWVAIKRIRADKGEAEENRERFQREARATARLNHSSIVHLYDIFRDGDNDCIVMEYVEGRTLDKLVIEGALDPLRVAALGEEIAAGLAEAHAKGILHRDLKVENIIVTPEGHAKILDFGLARPMLRGDLGEQLTGKGQLVGTSRAMAPEYVSGEEVDHRSDLFSLGVLLYEAATGHSPFKSHNTLATLKQVMLYRQTPAHQLSSRVPPELSDLIDRLLEKDPADRIQSAEETAATIRALSGQISSGSIGRPSSGAVVETGGTFLTPTATATSLDLLSRRRWIIAAAVLAAVLVGGLALIWWLGERPSVESEPATEVFSFAERDRIVVTDFENKTGEDMLDDSVDFAFRVGLEQSRFAQVLPRSQISAVLQRMKRDPDTLVDRDLGIEICRREGSKALVSGSIVKIGAAYTLTGTIVDPQSGASIFTTTAAADDQDGIVSALEKVAQAIRSNLGESLRAIEETRTLEKVTTGNLEALKAYTLGVAKIGVGEDEEAIRLFEQAIRLDPEFAMAHAKLGAYWIYYDPARALVHLDEAARLADRLTESERLYVEAWVARARGRPGEEFRIWSLLRSLYPNDSVGHVNVALVRWVIQYRFAEAAQALQQAEPVAAPEYLPRIYSYLAYCQLAEGQADEALASLKKAGDLRNWDALADIYIFMKRHREARLLIEEHLLAPNRTTQFEARVRLAYYYADQGLFADAVEVAQEAEAFARREGDDRMVLSSQLGIAVGLEQLGKKADVHRILAQANETAPVLFVSGQPDLPPIPLLTLIGKLNARSSDLKSAELYLSRIDPLVAELGVWQGVAKMLEGEILLARGRHQEAVARFKDSLSSDETFQAHESLARGFERLGDTVAAIAEYEWLVRNRGRAFVECFQARCQIASVTDWARAHYRLGRLHEESGSLDEAASYYRRLLDQWHEAEGLPMREDARQRLAALEERLAESSSEP